MKKLLSILTVSAIALSLPAGSFAAEKKAKPAAEAAPDAAKKPAEKPAAKPEAAAEKVAGEPKDPTKPISYYGDVAAVDATAKTFTFKNKDGKERIFSVGAEAKITKDGQPSDFSAITVGAYATGSYKKAADGKLDVLKVNIGPKPAKKPKGEGEAKPAGDKPADKPAEKKAN